MGDPLQFRPDRNFAPLLATAIVLVGGVVVCVGIMLAAGEVKPVPVALAVGFGVAMGMVLWSLREKPVVQRRSWFAWVAHGRGRKQRTTYELRILHPRKQYGQNRPPTLEELREMQDATRTWVPSGGRSLRGPRPRRSETES